MCSLHSVTCGMMTFGSPQAPPVAASNSSFLCIATIKTSLLASQRDQSVCNAAQDSAAPSYDELLSVQSGVSGKC